MPAGPSVPEGSERQILDAKFPSSSSASSSGGSSSGSNGSKIWKLLLGAGGIFTAFSYYGVLHEDILSKKTGEVNPTESFTQAWFLQAIEASVNVIVGYAGLKLFGNSSDLPMNFMAASGLAQVSAKSFTSSALASNVSFPLVTLAKSGKMIPIMIGSLAMGKKSYTKEEYLSVLAIIIGTCMVSKSKDGEVHSSLKGTLFILLSLICDGINGGIQDYVKEKRKESKKGSPDQWDLMFNTNLYMAIVAIAVSIFGGELISGTEFLFKHNDIFQKVLKFALCSAIGQSFIFYTLSNFDPLTTATITTTRKVFSVLLSIFIHRVKLSGSQKIGLFIACIGIFSELKKKSNEKEDVSGKTDKKAG